MCTYSQRKRPGPKTKIKQEKITMKRPRMSASKATGLVGTQENTFLTAILKEYISYMPLFDERLIRIALIDTMNLQHIEERLDFIHGKPKCCNESFHPSIELIVGRDKGFEYPVLDQAAGGALLWAGITFGALIKGCDDFIE